MRGGLEVAREAKSFLREAWRRSGRSQYELADQLGMTQGSVGNFLNDRNPNWQILTLVRIATGLGYDVEVVFRRREPPAVTPG